MVNTKQSHAAKYRLLKSKMHCFWYQKGPKTDTKQFFSDTMSMETPKCLLGVIDSKQKSTIQPCRHCQKSPKHCFQYQKAAIFLLVRYSIYSSLLLHTKQSHEAKYRLRKSKMQAVGVHLWVMLQICCQCERAYKAVFQCIYEQGIPKTKQ